MKNIFKYLAVLATSSLLVASCGFEEEAAPNEFVPAPEISISVDDVQDNSFYVTVAPQGEAGYYSVLVLPKGTVKGEVSAEDLFRLRYDSNLLCESVNYADKQSFTALVEGLAPSSSYEVYAVAGGKTGQVGKVTALVVDTPDTGAPKLEDAEFDEEAGAFKLTYSEEVAVGRGSFNVKSYAPLAYKLLGMTDPVYDQQVPAENVSAEANVITVSLEGLSYPGALCALSYNNEAVEDVSLERNFAPALNSVVVADKKGFPALQKGVAGNVANAAWKIKGCANEKLSEGDINKGALTFALLDEGAAGAVPNLALQVPETLSGTLTYTSKTREVVFSNPVLDSDLSSVVVLFGEELPEPDDKITVALKADQFFDLWGNCNEAFTQTLTYVSMLTEFYGSYIASGVDPFVDMEQLTDWELQIVPSVKKGLVEFKNMFAQVPLLRGLFEGMGVDFDPAYIAAPVIENGKLVAFSLDLGQVYSCSGLNFYLYVMNIEVIETPDGPIAMPMPVPMEEGAKVYFDVKEDGKLALREFGGQILGMYCEDLGGALDGAMSAVLTKVPAEK